MECNHQLLELYRSGSSVAVSCKNCRTLLNYSDQVIVKSYEVRHICEKGGPIAEVKIVRSGEALNARCLSCSSQITRQKMFAISKTSLLMNVSSPRSF